LARADCIRRSIDFEAESSIERKSRLAQYSGVTSVQSVNRCMEQADKETNRIGRFTRELQ
jgi:hypothetical protein